MSTTRERGRVLVVDDDEATRMLLGALLSSEGYTVEAAGTGEDALKWLGRAEFDLVLLDINLPDRSGIDVLIAGQEEARDTEFVMITAFASVDTAVDAMKRGAYDYLRKPLHTEELLQVVHRVVSDVKMRPGIARLKRLASPGIRERMVGQSRQMEDLWNRIEKVAPTRATVLITGETGVGKELVASAIHELSPRCLEPLVATTCSSLETLLESELFGHETGSLTGASATRRGLFEEASRGTLFLDEVSDMPERVQVELLRVIQERRIRRMGSRTPIPVDLRLIAATNVDLEAEVARGAFRADLFYRLGVFPIRVPPLRERREDIPLLARHILDRAAAQLDVETPELPPSTLRAMTEFDWPGNVRQMENVIESAIITCCDGVIHFAPEDVMAAVSDRHRAGAARQAANDAGYPLARLERDRIYQALEQSAGHRGRAAALLGIDRRTLYRKLKSYDADDSRHGSRKGGPRAGTSPR